MATTAPSLKPKVGMAEIFASRKSLAMLALGASAGLPIMLVYQVLSVWLRDVGVSRTAIGFFVWVGFAYSLKFLWAPLVDRFRVPGFSDWLGNRRGWTLLAILGTATAMFAMAFQDPSKDLASVALCAVMIAFASATLDICVDAWRVDNALNSEQATFSAIYQLGYRFGMIAAVSGGLFIAELTDFNTAYILLGVLAVIGASTPLWAPNVRTDDQRDVVWPIAILKGVITLAVIAVLLYIGMRDGGFLRVIGGWLGQLFSGFPPRLAQGLGIFILLSPFLAALAFLLFGKRALGKESTYLVPILGDFADLVRRTGYMSLAVLAIIVTYRISDTTMGVMAGPLYIDLGYTKDTIGAVKGLFGISILIVGAFLGGWAANALGMARAMIIGAVLTIATNLAFAWLATVTEPRAIYLFVTIGADNIAAGFAGSVFIAFMSILTNKKFSASQYALFSSMFAFYGKSLAGFSGVLADRIGYEMFFVVTALFGVPALILVIFTWLNGFTDSIDEDGIPKSRQLSARQTLIGDETLSQ